MSNEFNIHIISAVETPYANLIERLVIEEFGLRQNGGNGRFQGHPVKKDISLITEALKIQADIVKGGAIKARFIDKNHCEVYDAFGRVSAKFEHGIFRKLSKGDTEEVVFEAPLLNGKCHGEVKKFTSNGLIKCTYQKGVQVGEVVFQLADNSVCRFELGKNFTFNRKVIFTTSSGSVEEVFDIKDSALELSTRNYVFMCLFCHSEGQPLLYHSDRSSDFTFESFKEKAERDYRELFKLGDKDVKVGFSFEPSGFTEKLVDEMKRNKIEERQYSPV